MVEYSVLSLLYLLSYFKLFVTLVKYIPQVSQLIETLQYIAASLKNSPVCFRHSSGLH